MTDVKDVFEIDPARLDQIATDYAEAYQTAEPFPHIVIDDLVDPDLLNEVLSEVCDDRELPWNKTDDRFQKKYGIGSTRQLRPKTRQLLNFLNGQEVIGFLEKLTGISGLVGDWQFAGGGLHVLPEGGFLNVHADFNVQRHLKLDRRINLLLYLNKDWEEEYGGALELWDKQMTACRKKVMPVFNRCVIFNTTDFSYHGNPDPVRAPGGRKRLSLAMYYYSNGRPKSEQSQTHMTKFQHRPGEETRKDRLKSQIKRFVPPIITEWLDLRRQ